MRSPPKTGCELRCPRRVCSFCSTIGNAQPSCLSLFTLGFLLNLYCFVQCFGDHFLLFWFFFWSFYHFTSLCLIYIIRVPLFCCVSFYHCTSLCFIYRIRLPLWYLRTIVRRDDFGLCSKLEEINQIIVICSNVSAKL